jgi:hypothetical protein
MSRPASAYSDDVTVYLVLNDRGQFGIAYDETDPAEADRETIIRNFLSGQYSNALRVVGSQVQILPLRPDFFDFAPGSSPGYPGS